MLTLAAGKGLPVSEAGAPCLSGWAVPQARVALSGHMAPGPPSPLVLLMAWAYTVR